MQEVLRTFNYRHIFYLKMPYDFSIGFGSVGFGEYWKTIIVGPHCLQSVILIPILGPQCLQSVNRIPIIGPQCLQSVNLKSSSMFGRILRGFFPGKMTISGILEHTNFQKVCISLF